MNTIITEIIFFFELSLYFVGFYIFMKPKMPDLKKVWIKTALYYVAYLVGYYFLQQWTKVIATEKLGNPFIAVLFNTAVGFASSYLFFEGKVGRRILSYAIYAVPAVLSEILILPIFLKALVTNPVFEINSYLEIFVDDRLRVVAIVAEAQMIVCVWMLLILIVKIFIDKDWPKTYIGTVLFPAFQLYTFSLFYQSLNRIDNTVVWEGFMLFLLGIVIDIALLFLVIKTFKDKMLEVKLENLETERQMNEIYNELTEENYEQMRMLKHDLLNRIQIVYAAINNGNINEAKELLDQSSEEIKEQSVKKYCANTIINTILNVKSKEAGSKGISFDIKCDVPEVLTINSGDLCTIFNNVLDNAIEAVLGLNSDEKTIACNCGIVNDYLTLKVSNPCRSDVSIKDIEASKTTKEDKKNHGMGIRRIKQVVAKYKGMMSMDIKDGIYEIVIGIKI